MRSLQHMLQQLFLSTNDIALNIITSLVNFNDARPRAARAA